MAVERETPPVPPPENPSAASVSFGRKMLNALLSLRAAIYLTVIIGVSFPAWFSIYGEIDRLKQDHVLAIDADLGRSATLIAMAMREPMWQFAAEQADSIIEASFATDPRILAIIVRDYEGRTFAERERPAPDAEPSINHTRPVTKDGKSLGIVVVEMTTSGYQKKLTELQGAYLSRGLITLVGSLAFIAIVLQFRLVAPINRLVGVSEELAKGTLNQPVQGGGQDELGRLARSLESTRQALAGLIATLESKNTELQEANDRLEARVAERTTELENALNTLRDAQRNIIESEKLASLGRVVAGVAHELNTPIGNALIVASSIHDRLTPLQQELAGGSVRKSTLMESIGATTEGMVILMRSLSKAAQMIGDFKQVAVDQTSEQRRVFDLSEVTQEVLGTLQPSFRKSPVSLVTDLSSGIVCDSYPGPYGQVLTNLLMNTLIHAFEGRDSGEVKVTTDSPRQNWARLTVTDNGVGMPADVKAKVFDPFFTTRMGRGGTGLGMNIVHSFVVRVLKGRIEVESQPGQGSRFVIEFPCSADEAHAASTAPD